MINIIHNREKKSNFYIITDHLRTTIFALADGATFESKGRGYILRKLIKKVVLLSYSFHLTIEDLIKVSEKLIEINSSYYHQLEKKNFLIIDKIKKEINKSLKLINDSIEKLNKYYSPTITAQDIFFWYDTWGIPLRLIQTYFDQHNYQFPYQQFSKLLTEQKKRSLADRRNKNIPTF